MQAGFKGIKVRVCVCAWVCVRVCAWCEGKEGLLCRASRASRCDLRVCAWVCVVKRLLCRAVLRLLGSEVSMAEATPTSRSEGSVGAA